MSTYNRAWLLGFLSGVAAANPGYGDPFSTLSIEQVYLWMDNWCKANPLSEVHRGAFALLQDLKAKK